MTRFGTVDDGGRERKRRKSYVILFYPSLIRYRGSDLRIKCNNMCLRANAYYYSDWMIFIEASEKFASSDITHFYAYFVTINIFLHISREFLRIRTVPVIYDCARRLVVVLDFRRIRLNN